MVMTDRIDGLTASVAVKAPVRVATTVPITLSGLQVIDGVSVVPEDRVLVMNQANSQDNGIYSVNTSTWLRTKDFDGARDAVEGTLVYVVHGNTHQDNYYRVTTANPIIFGSSNITFIRAELAAEAVAQAQQAADEAEASANAAAQAVVFGQQYDYASDMDASVSADNGSILQAHIDAIVATAASNGHATGLKQIILKPSSTGFYCTTGLTTAPWVKLWPISNHVKLIFDDLSSSGTAIVINGNNTPSGELEGGAYSGAQNSPALQNVKIVRTTTKGTTLGIDIGATSGSGGYGSYKNTREARLTNVDVAGFATGVMFRKTDNYLTTLENVRSYLNTVQMQTEAGNASNAHEKMVINGGVLGQGGQSGKGFVFGTSGGGWKFNGVSFDYNYTNAVEIASTCTYLTAVFDKCWFENSNDNAVIHAVGSDSQRHITVRSSDIVPKIYPNSTVAVGGFADGSSSPFQALFKGAMSLTLDGITIQGYDNYYVAATEDNMFMCDSDVKIVSARGIRFTNAQQLISRSLISNYNSNFTNCSSAANLLAGDTGGISLISSTNMTVTVDNTQTFSASTQALKFTSSNNSSAATIHFRPFAVIPGVIYGAQPVLYGNGAGGFLNVQTKIKWYRLGNVGSVAISGITRSGNTATVTTVDDHRLTTGMYVDINGVDENEYNRRAYITVTDATTFTYLCNNAAGSLSSPATVTNASYSVEGMIPISDSSIDTNGFASLYQDTAQPGYTGGSAYWAKGRYLSGRQAPVGAAFGVLECVVSAVNSGDAVYLGEVAVNPK